MLTYLECVCVQLSCRNLQQYLYHKVIVLFLVDLITKYLTTTEIDDFYCKNERESTYLSKQQKNYIFKVLVYMFVRRNLFQKMELGVLMFINLFTPLVTLMVWLT